ncbi:GntR family transcriptional regulator [Bacillus sp. FJAT-29790]|uniref:GntR family transcriptional regulator n=1 Tax=Bacillus sp. FJAT-29790 TaxID=1895002 RepID=UPI001C235842|nr:GntR family transcriptional regulator [Bacillus sp. FJAT-29790]MBU8878194.1 GntR family transcriptional regulator [Bacillus sp. FJAT-29790]
MKKYAVNNTPLYLTVKNTLLEAIKNKEIGDNGRLPSEQALSEKFGVSRATIRSALQSLETEGVINKRHGSSTVINTEGLQVKMRIDEFKGFFHLIKESGHQPSIAQKNLVTVSHDSRIANFLGIDYKEEVLLIQRLFTGDDIPVILASEYIPQRLLTQELKIDDIPESIFDLADMFCIDTIAHTITEIRSSMANPDQKKKLGMEKNETLIKLEETHYGKQGKPLIFSDILVRDKIIRFHSIRKR